MKALTFLLLLLAIIAALLNAGCNTSGYEVRNGSMCKLGVDGRCYHIGDEWTQFRLDKNFKYNK